MRASLYIDKGAPLLSVYPEKLSDGSAAWNICIRGGDILAFESEAKADAAFRVVAQAVQMSMSDVLIL